MADDTSGVLEQFANDAVYNQFLRDDFDAKTVACSAIQDLSISQHLAKLATGISLLDKELHSQSKVVEPYNKSWTQTAMLARLQQTCDMIRRMGRLFQIVKRLRAQLQGGTKDITKAAQSLSEADQLLEGVDLSGVEVVQDEIAVLAGARQELERQAERMLEKGTESQNQNQVGTALQVLFHLQLLQPRVLQLVRSTLERLRDTVQQALSVGSLDQQATATFGSRDSAAGAGVGQKEGPRDPRGFPPGTAKESTFLRQAFEGEYPKLLSLFNGLWKRLDQIENQASSGGGEGEPTGHFLGQQGDFKLEEALCGTLAPLEKAYLSRSVSRLLDAVNVALSGSSRESRTVAR
ncbi:hypothetical protein HPB48_000002 [Haemaphysalis longicornis]|uniref:Conserved oligomeric Golgi complex subunit 5 helical domain-containing protein n=1 Tax=Haemaphysalis longicornis TaxID=44386 RepID=A0A9J6FN06_HAELO|nr:hypothetical protein HPB48_000002 [Haemaphysalis longicornis]